MQQTDFFFFLDQLPDPSFLVDKNLNILYSNSKFEHLLGYESGTLSGMALKTLLEGNTVESSIKKFLTEPKETDNNGFNNAVELRLKTRNDEGILVKSTSSMVELEGFNGNLLTLQQTNQAGNQALEAAAHSAISTWNIGVFHDNHITGEVLTSPEFDNMFALEEGKKFTIEQLTQGEVPTESEMIRKAVEMAYDPNGDGNFDVTHQLATKSGRIRWIHSRCKTYFEEHNGKRIPAYTMGTIRDITEQKKLDQALVQNQKRLAQAIEVAQVGIFEHEHIGPGIEPNLYWSPLLREMLGVDESYPADLDWYLSFIPAEDLERVNAAFIQSHDINGDGYYEVENRWLHPDGNIHWFYFRGRTFFKKIKGQKSPVLTVGAVIDITARKAIEDDIHKRSAILESTPDFVGITDLKGNLIYLNQSGRKIVGIDANSDVTGINMGSLHTEEATQYVLDNGIPCAIDTGSWKAEVEMLNHDGTFIPMSQVILAHKDSDAEVAYFSVVARDLSREKALEEQFYQAQKMEAIGRLAGGIAHDFNNMLSVIMGFTTLAANNIDSNHESQMQLEQVLQASQKAADMTEHLLAFSRKQIMQLVVVDTNTIIAGMEMLVRRLVGDNILVEIILSDYSCCIKADPIQIEQVILNLVINARDAMTSGGKLILETAKVTFEDDQVTDRLDLNSGTYIMIAVSDTGEGMDAATSEKVFEPFFTTKELHQGTGLGLATVYGIVKQSGGTIWVYSEPGKGTVFKTYFPCTDEAAIVPRDLFDDEQQKPGAVILLAEDEPQVRAMVNAVLANAGYTVVNACDGKEALQISDNYKDTIDLLLTDVVMPGMSGKELADKLLETRPETQVLYMSGYTENTIVHHGVLDKDVNFLAKPLTPKKLLKTIAQLFNINDVD